MSMVSQTPKRRGDRRVDTHRVPSNGRHPALWALFATLLAFHFLLLIGAMPARAWSNTAYKCAVSGCKYGQYRAAYDSLAHHQTDHRGSTASGSCDPSNNVIQWRVSETRTYENGSSKYSAGPLGWHTNCSLSTYYWTQTVPRDYSPGLMRSRGHFEWDASCTGCDFDEFIWTAWY